MARRVFVASRKFFRTQPSVFRVVKKNPLFAPIIHKSKASSVTKLKRANVSQLTTAYL